LCDPVAILQRRKKWKDSTDRTTTERIQTYLLKAFEDFELTDLSRDRLQKFLNQKARSLSRSVVSHLRWDLNAIFKMAAEDVGNPRLARNLERSEDADETRHDQRTGSARIDRVESEGEADFSAGCPGRNATRRDSRSALGES
jgi:hypothetical protein